MDSVSTDHLHFVTFVLRQYFKIFSYPIEISNIIVLFLKEAGKIFKLTFHVREQWRKIFDMMNKISDECCIQTTRSDITIFTPNDTISIIVTSDDTVFDIYSKYSTFIVTFKTIELIKKINEVPFDSIITICIENFLSSNIIISNILSSSKIKSIAIKNSFLSYTTKYSKKFTLDIKSFQPIYKDLICDALGIMHSRDHVIIISHDDKIIGFADYDICDFNKKY